MNISEMDGQWPVRNVSEASWFFFVCLFVFIFCTWNAVVPLKIKLNKTNKYIHK